MSNILSPEFKWSKEPTILRDWNREREREKWEKEKQEREEAALRAVRGVTTGRFSSSEQVCSNAPKRK
jgi:hypothetical protein